MPSFGERLQREREMRGITLDEMSEATKITSRCLRALEEEEFDKLPGGIFNKGFVRAYARHVGIDEDQAVADFIAASGGEKEQPLPDPQVARPVVLGQPQRAEGEINWRAFALLALVVVAAAAVVWKAGPSTVRKIYRELTAFSDRAAAPAGIVPQSSHPAQTEAPPVQSKSTPAASTSAPTHAPQPAVNAPEPAPPPPTQNAPRAATPAPAPPAPATPEKPQPKAAVVAPSRPAAPAAPASAQSRSFVVQVRAMEDAWVQIVADGRLVSEGVLVPPAQKRVPAAKEVIVKTGNAAGVEVSFNGQPLPTLGEENQMATVTLTSAGVRP